MKCASQIIGVIIFQISILCLQFSFNLHVLGKLSMLSIIQWTYILLSIISLSFSIYILINRIYRNNLSTLTSTDTAATNEALRIIQQEIWSADYLNIDQETIDQINNILAEHEINLYTIYESGNRFMSLHSNPALEVPLEHITTETQIIGKSNPINWKTEGF